MRTLTSAALTQIATKLGNEPITIVEIAWNLDGSRVAYADRTIGSIPGKIIQLGELDNVVNVGGNGQSQQIELTLDDTDGSLKAILDVADIHQRDAWVYQYFDGMDLADKFLLFKGKITSPISYKEGDRSLSFSITSQLEDTEIGFSAEEGQFNFIDDDLIGKAWPMNFGTVVQGATLRLTKTYKGLLAEGTGVADFALPYRRDISNVVGAFYNTVANGYYYLRDVANAAAAEATAHGDVAEHDRQIAEAQKQQTNGDRYNEQAVNFFNAANSVETVYENQVATQLSQFHVIGGEKFPRGPIMLKIGETIYSGNFDGATNLFKVLDVKHPKKDDLAVSPLELTTPQVPGAIISSFTVTGEAVPRFFSIKIFGEHAGYVFNEAGTPVELFTVEGQQYIVSITPGTVRQAWAFLNKNGVRKLITLPSEYYSVSTHDYGAGLTAVVLTITDAISKLSTGTFEDAIFCTFESDVGPNTVDVLQYLIETYTDFNIDSASFAAVHTSIANYPSHFQLTDRKQIFTALQEISWQARCALWLSNGTFYIRYLPLQPDSVATFEDSDLDVSTLEVGFTSTEEIVTKMICSWRSTPAQQQDNKVILRHNVKKYGTKERSFDFYIYNAVDFVVKSATFWLIRYANTWKKATFQTPLHKLNIETLDNVTLDFNKPWLATDATPGVVEQAAYDSNSQQLNFTVWTPIRSGEMTPYDFAFPADIDETLQFPTDLEEEFSFDGSNGPNKNTGEDQILGVGNGEFTVPYTGTDPYNLNGDSNANRSSNDRGQRRPSDVGDSSPGSPVISATPALVRNTKGPLSPSVNNTVPNVTPNLSTTTSGGISQIDIDTTVIHDPISGKNARLRTFFNRIDTFEDADVLMGDPNAIYRDSDSHVGPVVFRWDTVTSQFGAGLAFLWDTADDPV
jgi:hypothetical protein